MKYIQTILILVLSFQFFSAVGQPTNRETRRNEHLAPEVQIKSFEIIWKKIREEHFDPTLGSKNMHVYEKYKPLVKKEMHIDSFHNMMNTMLSELGESHLSVSAAPRAKGDRHAVGSANVGLELDDVQNGVVVTRIEASGPAANSLINVGDELIAIDNISVREVYRQEMDRSTPANARLLKNRVAIAAYRKLNGPDKARVTLKLIKRNKKAYTVILNRAISKSHGVSMESTFTKLDSVTGYLRIPAWMGNLPRVLDSAFAAFRSCKNIIIDLRGNNGGVGAYIVNLMNRLMRDSGSLGNLNYRNKVEAFSYKGSGDSAFQGKIVVLVNEKSASSSEVFASAMKESGRGTVIGSRTAGAVLYSLFEQLPSGGTVLYPIADLHSPKGHRLEGNGVRPDIEVRSTKAGVRAGRDEVLEKAVSRIRRTTLPI